jgi:tetratricopeptide (TPR) repeat protein
LHLRRDYREAVEILEEASVKYPDSKEIFIRLGDMYRCRFRRYDKAIASYSRVVELDPTDEEAYSKLAHAHHNAGDSENAVLAMNRYITLAPDEPNPYDTRGGLYAMNGDIQRAMESYRAAIEIRPDFWRSVENLGHMYLFTRDYEKAEAQYRTIAAGPDVDWRSYGRHRLALVPIYQGKFEEAVRVLEDGLAADRLDGYEGVAKAAKHSAKAWIHLARGEYDLAVTEARRARPFADPRGQEFSGDALLIYVLARAGRPDEARRVLRDYKDRVLSGGGIDLSSYWWMRGNVAVATGDVDSALAHYAEAGRPVETLPFSIRVGLAEACIQSGRLGEAVSIMEAALSSYDSGRVLSHVCAVRAHYVLGLAYEKSGWSTRAIEEYEEFLEIWRGADPGLAVIEDARERLPRLTQSP